MTWYYNFVLCFIAECCLINCGNQSFEYRINQPSVPDSDPVIVTERTGVIYNAEFFFQSNRPINKIDLTLYCNREDAEHFLGNPHDSLISNNKSTFRYLKNNDVFDIIYRHDNLVKQITVFSPRAASCFINENGLNEFGVTCGQPQSEVTLIYGIFADYQNNMVIYASRGIGFVCNNSNKTVEGITTFIPVKLIYEGYGTDSLHIGMHRSDVENRYGNGTKSTADAVGYTIGDELYNVIYSSDTTIVQIVYSYDNFVSIGKEDGVVKRQIESAAYPLEIEREYGKPDEILDEIWLYHSFGIGFHITSKGYLGNVFIFIPGSLNG